MKTAYLLLVALLFTSTSPAAETARFSFAPGQKVFVVALDLYGDLEHSKPNLVAQREIEQRFAKRKKFVVTPHREQADFIFFYVTDPTSPATESYAVAVLPNANIETPITLASLRAAGIWEKNDHYKRGRNVAAAAAAAGVTLGAGLIFAQHSIAKELTDQFHAEVLKK